MQRSRHFLRIPIAKTDYIPKLNSEYACLQLFWSFWHEPKWELWKREIGRKDLYVYCLSGCDRLIKKTFPRAELTKHRSGDAVPVFISDARRMNVKKEYPLAYVFCDLNCTKVV